jgi:predicted MFS family arabinose efflux permease
MSRPARTYSGQASIREAEALVQSHEEERTMDRQREKARIRKGAWRTVWAIGGASFVDAVESHALSSAFPVIEQSLGLNVGHLGIIRSTRKIAGLIAGSLWSMAADRISRKAVLVWGTGVWGIWTLAVGFAANYQQLLIFSVLSGIGLAAGGAITSLIADLFPQQERGKAFGITSTIAYVCSVLALLPLSRLLQVPELGWRAAFWLLGGLSVLSGVLIWLFVDEPVRGQSEAALVNVIDQIGQESETRYPFSLKKLPALFRTRTMLVHWARIIPDVFTTATTSGFLVTWLADERRYAPGIAPLFIAPLAVGCAVGSTVGGISGDWADGKSARHGRIVVGQLSYLGSAITSYLLFQIPWDSALAYGGLLFALGFAQAIRYPAASSPLRVAVMVPEIRTTGSSVGGVIASLSAALASYVMGQLATSVGLTRTFFWSSTVAGLVGALVSFLYYPVYHEDAAHVQQVLAGRRSELSKDAK